MRKSKYTKQLLEPIINSSFSWAQVIEKLNLKKTGGNYRNIQSHTRHHNIDTSHFKGQGWSKGETKENNKSVRCVAEKNSLTIENALVENYSGTIAGPRLKKLMLEYGFKYICENGHLPYWMDKELTLHVDHINGICNDNRPENLRFLCPNCHQQTTTWGNKKNNWCPSPDSNWENSSA